MNRNKIRAMVLERISPHVDMQTAHGLALDAVKLMETHGDIGEHAIARCLDLGAMAETDLFTSNPDNPPDFYAVGSWLALGRLVQRKVLRAQRREAAK